MGKTMTPRGVTKKDPCTKCGRLFFRFFEGNKLRTECTICKSPKEELK